LLAVQFVVLGGSYLANYLYRATGRVAQGSWMLFAECVVRVPVAALLLRAVGLPGLPAAAIATAVVSGGIARSLTVRALSDASRPAASFKPFVGRAAILGGAAIVGARFPQSTWMGIVSVCACTAIASAAVVGATDPVVRGVVRRLTGAVAAQ
jgi:hypothetical protein